MKHTPENDLKKATDGVTSTRPGKLQTQALKDLGGVVETGDVEQQEVVLLMQEMLKKGANFKRMQAALQGVAKMDNSIKAFFESQGQEITDFRQKSSGVQDGTIVYLSKGERYYVKTYEKHKSDKLDPKEFFVYKVLELTGFDSKAEFIPALKSKSADGYYIATLDASYSKNENKHKKFKTGTKYTTELTKEGFEEKTNSFLQDRRFATECVALETLINKFALSDTFTNSGNYGFIESRFEADGESKEKYDFRAKPKLIDFRMDGDGNEKTFTKKVEGLKRHDLSEIETEALQLILEGRNSFYKREGFLCLRL